MALSGPDLTSGTTNGDTLPAQIPDGTWEERQISVTPYELTSGVQYTIIVRAPNAESNTALRWVAKYLGSYSGGSLIFSSDSGSNWNYNALYDGWFSTDSESYTFAGTSAYASLGKATWEGQTITPTSTFTINSITLKLQRSSAGGTPDTVGTITASIRKVLDLPTKPTNPTPSDASSDVTLDQQTITWEDGGGATSYDVYYGTESGNLSLLESGVTDTSYTVFGITNGSPFDYTVTRYWRIDAVNAYGTTTGDEWSFTTITFSPPPPGLRGFDSSGGGEGDFAGGTIGDGQSNIKTRLVAFTRNKVFYEDT